MTPQIRHSYPREKIVALVRKFGCSTADAVLDTKCKHFIHPEIEGFIPYRLEFKTAVVFGDPVCHTNDIDILVKAFHKFYQNQNISIIYIIVSKSFANWAVKNISSSLIEFGQELTLNPLINNSLKKSSLWSKKLRRAKRENVQIEEYLDCDSKKEQTIEETKNFWLSSRKGAQTYITNTFLFQDRFGRRWFLAKKNETLIGIALLNHLEQKQGWLLSQIFLSPNSPVGTSEALVANIVETLSKEKYTYLSFGAVPASSLGEITGLKKFSTSLIRTLFKFSRKIFHLDGKKIYWKKFQPTENPSYLLFDQNKIKIKNIAGLIKTANMHL